MNSLSYGLIVLLSMLLLVQGCGDAKVEQPGTGAKEGKEAVSSIESQPVQPREDGSPPEKRSQELARGRLSQDRNVEATVPGTPAATAGSRLDRKPSGAPSAREGLDRQSRIELMAAKALAEYKAKRERERLEGLTRDLEEKERELEGLKENALAKEQEAATLKSKIEEIQASADKRVAQLDSELKKIGEELGAASSEADRLKREVDEKTTLLEALKNAATDAGKLKASAESELSRLRAQLDETQQELEKAQSEREEFRQEIQLLQSQIEQSTEERDQYREAAEKLQSEADQARQDVEGLRSQISKLRSELETFQPAAEAPVDTAQSRVDLILRLPVKGQVSEQASNLY